MKMTPLKIILAFSFFLLMVTRLVNLDRSSRFLWDESSDLVKIHQYWSDKKVTLVGPISEDGSKVFGSLTYYMLMPFAVINRFTPISTTYGAAFWGMVSSVTFCYLLYKYSSKRLWAAVMISIFITLLLISGRWAWNPNFIPLWICLGLIFSLSGRRYHWILSGIFLGLSVHHHYLAIFTVAGYLFVSLFGNQKDKLKKLVYTALGVFISLLPFIIFDLRHPPGLFLSRILYFNNTSDNLSIYTYIINVITSVKSSIYSITQNDKFSTLLGIALATLLLTDIKHKDKSLKYFSVWLIHISLLGIIRNIYPHYLFSGLIFLIIWIYLPRKDVFSNKLSGVCLATVIFCSLLNFPKIVFTTGWESDIRSTTAIALQVKTEIMDRKLTDFNIAVLGSPDPNTYGRKFRDILLIDGIRSDDKGEYDKSKYLFAISYLSEADLRNDPSYEMSSFKMSKLLSAKVITNSSWKIYLFAK